MEKEASPNFQLPPGFRFHPSDEELIVHYLRNKAASLPLPASIIAEIDLYKYNPWELPGKALFGEDEWYFFSPRARKYPNGARPNRAAGSGYWKATATDKPILTSSGTNSIGVKKALVFYAGKPPKGIKTEWIMNEYRLLDTTMKPSMARGSMRLDDWVLCQIRQKGKVSKNVSDVYGRHNNTPKMEEASRTYTHYKTDMILDCINKDCRLLASILAGQALPPIQNSFTSDYQEERSNKLSSGATVFSFDSHPSSLKRKPCEDSRHDNLLLSYKKLSSSGNGDLLTEDRLAWSDVNYYGQNQYQEMFYNFNRFDQISGFLELNEPGFSSKY